MIENRVIKFRAWDKEEKRMWWNVQNAYDMQENHHTPDPAVESDKGGDALFSSSFGSVLEQCDRYVVMQFTGTLDRIGQEIYEGDLLFILPEGMVKPVVWADNGFWVIWDDGSRHFPTKEYREVVGNVYENPT